MHIETSLLLDSNKNIGNKLSVIFAIVCIIDVFGVFPVVALPKAIIDCGFYGIAVLVVVCSVQIYTATLLGKCWVIAEKIDFSLKDKSRYPYAALAEITYGAKFSNFVSVLVNLTIFFGGIPNLIVASQNLQLLGLRLSDDEVDVPFCYWIMAIGLILCPVLWLGSPKDMKLLCSISVCIVILVFLLVFGCLVFLPSPTTSSNSTPERPLWELIFVTYGIISFQYDIHPSILAIQVDMKEKSKLNRALVGAFLRASAVITLISAIKFGYATKPSILETLPTTVALHFAAFFVALQLCLSLAISNSALFQQVEDCMRIPQDFNHRRCILRTTLNLLAVLIAESVPRFDLVMSLIGGTLTGPLVFILPPMFYLKMLALEKKHVKEEIGITLYGTDGSTLSVANIIEKKSSKCEITCCAIIICVSVCSTVTTTFINFKSFVNFSNFTEPCIVNVTLWLLEV